jgi:hypothetical protein
MDAALNEALTQLQFPLLVASFIFLVFARSSVAERFFSSRQLYLLAELLFYNLLANMASFRLSRKTYLG